MKKKEFFDYLMYIGIVSNDSFQLLTSLDEKKTKEIENNNIIDKNSYMKSIMGEYLTLLSKDELSKLGYNIYDKYISNKFLTIKKHLSKLSLILENKLFQNLKLFYNNFKNKMFNGKSSRSKFYPRSKSTDKLFYTSNNKKNNNLSSSNNFSDINLSNNYNYYNNQSLSPNFYYRQNKFENKKEKDRIKIMNEEDLGIICTFSPNLSLTKKKNNKFRKKFSPLKPSIIEQPKKTTEKPKKKVDNDRMNKLYSDFQKKNLNNEILKKIIDKENGITFSPKLNANSLYNKRIKETFYERNLKLLKDKKDFVKVFNYLKD